MFKSSFHLGIPVTLVSQYPVVKATRSQVVFSSILPVRGEGNRRRALIMKVNNCLQRWCWLQGFGSTTMEHCPHISICLGDGIHLSKQGKDIFARRMADWARQALN